jgi:hypothetical protein
MPATIQQLVTTDGTTYSMGHSWPGAAAEDGPESLKVGPIFFLNGEEEPVMDEDGDVAATISQPPRYEVWCVTDRLLAVFVGHLRGMQVPEVELQHIATSRGMVRRIIGADQVASTDENWPAVVAFQKLVERFVEMNDSEEEGVAAESQSQSQPQPPPGNGTTQQARG